jgi:hypothetical protein
MSGPKVGQLVVDLFGLARNQNAEVGARWIRLSHRVGLKLPRSLLAVSLQRLGEFDLVCRSLESELATTPPREGEMDFRCNYLMLLSELWIGSAYAACYTLDRRKILSDAAFLRLADDLRMIRIQIEKFKVPSDWELAEALQLTPTQLRPDETEAPIYEYDKKDPLRAHIPPMGLSARWSAMWQVIDVKADSSPWYERLELSDRMLNVLDPADQASQ